MAYCKECGAELRAKAKFCPNCGARIIAGAPKVLEEPKTKPTKIEVSEAKEIDPNSILMFHLKFGVVAIVAGFLARLLIVNIIAKEITDSGTTISFGNWVLILAVIMGILIFGFGIADYVIARKKIEPLKMITNLKVGIAFIATGFLARRYLTDVVAKDIQNPANIISVGDWLLILLVIIGLLIIGFGIAGYAIAGKKRR